MKPALLIRRATAEDNLEILAFQARHAMRGALPLRFDRAPDYFSLLRCHAEDHRTWVAQDEQGVLKGVASAAIRDANMSDHVEPVAYFGDLRLMQNRHLARAWRDEMLGLLADLKQQAGVNHSYCCMIRDNRLAAQSLLHQRRSGKLALTHWRGYSNVSVYGRKGWLAPAAENNGIRIVQAQAKDADKLLAFLAAESQQQPFGCVFSESEFARRLKTWPDFDIASFLLALDAGGDLLGCVAPWDTRRIKRIVVEKLPPTLQAVRLGYNAVAPLLGRPHMAASGEALNDCYLTHLQIKDRSPAVFSALLDAAWRQVRSASALMQLCLYEGDPLWPCMARYRWLHIPMDLYTLAPHGAAPTFDRETAARIPGFEIYLV